MFLCLVVDIVLSKIAVVFDICLVLFFGLCAVHKLQCSHSLESITSDTQPPRSFEEVMRQTLIVAAIASLAVANAQPQDHSVPVRDIDHLEKRAAPGWLECKQGGLKKPCTFTEAGGKGALDCHKLIYGNRMSNPGMSFKPDKGVTCRFYDTKGCGVLSDPLNVESPGGDLLSLGRAAKTWGPDDIEGFWSFRCRCWQQKDDDEKQSKYIKLPAKP